MKVRMQITLEIDVPDSWGPDCTLGQVRRQAIESAEQALRRGLVINGLTSDGPTKTPARIVGPPNVTAAIFDIGEAKP